MSEIILSKLETLPEFLSSYDLVALGLYPSKDSAYLARSRGNSPDYIKFGAKVLYPKDCVKDFIKKKLKSGSSPRNSIKE